MEDIDISNLKNQKNPFDRTERPGSMISVQSNASTSSRSSVNCATGRIRCPNMRLKKFFSYKSVICYFLLDFVNNLIIHATGVYTIKHYFIYFEKNCIRLYNKWIKCYLFFYE